MSLGRDDAAPLSTTRARGLRNRMTPEEKHLWYDYLKHCGWRFNRQFPIGNYIVDFYCPAAGLVIEIDGSQHYDEKGRTYDAERTAYLESYGLQVVRILNRDIWTHFDNWCAYLDELLESRTRGQS